MDIDIQQLARKFDEEFGSGAQRHDKKLAAIPEALNADEAVTFITDVQLAGNFRTDILVATDSRLLVVRKDGKRIDEHDLSEIASLTLTERLVGSYLTLTIASNKWKGWIKSEPAALALTQELQDTCVELRNQRSLPTPIFNVPSTASRDLAIWKQVLAFDRDYGTSLADHRQQVLAIPDAPPA